ncbi:MAG: NUDIX hydrolase [Dehalococcoidia bacterium]|nr:NUDIX hydrolase [Dehalococcoidia bacterium]
MATQRAGRSQALPFQIATSAGGVVCRLHEERWQVVLCGPGGQGLWSLPKGSPEPGETLEQTALREVREETGLAVEVREPLGSITYWFTSVSEGARYRKTVHFFLMHPTGGSLERHDAEFAEVRWYPMEEALEALGYKDERHMVRLALEKLGDK